ncbi:hypothetical protein C3432_12845 [Citrobacter amalonaticus]|uniref:Uncharacterized protein n=1 Tax=Citrobacter amalonaticus TaxID=35703 RepID=A0A2S4RVR8_CITAM|nr:hypothetical protein [Citrobacter amalonaticus]POT56317.1 hypothetical protein C3432_12845 [Citrobacter amalonaticus]POT74842.1 hypothetical protein C3436_13315 [Citrobacter amalonaticus]POU64371.1 hypothetical protein C3430_14335 [Citrobacter amalonaticus]POV04207.1 hypothetical protein C3424_13655 [Citrobacter amalonaticus]
MIGPFLYFTGIIISRLLPLYSLSRNIPQVGIRIDIPHLTRTASPGQTHAKINNRFSQRMVAVFCAALILSQGQ